jgi:outer membrane receptor protein involved in Fe transport
VNALYDLVQSVTLDPRTRQRQNVAQARALGIEADARWRPVRPLTFVASYALTRSRVASSPANPALVGQRLPSTPLHRGALTGMLDLPDLLRASARVWAESLAFADDRNTLRLPAFAQLDLSLGRALTREIEVQVSMTNALDSRIVTGRDATVTNVAAPRTIWVAVRGSY